MPASWARSVPKNSGAGLRLGVSCWGVEERGPSLGPAKRGEGESKNPLVRSSTSIGPGFSESSRADASTAPSVGQCKDCAGLGSILSSRWGMKYLSTKALGTVLHSAFAASRNIRKTSAIRNVFLLQVSTCRAHCQEISGDLYFFRASISRTDKQGMTERDAMRHLTG
jgi:hypothetical protein